MAKNDLTVERVLALLKFAPETGDFIRLITVRPAQYAGCVAGSLQQNGYVHIGIDRYRYLAHRLAWFVTHGAWPTGQIDHINGIRADNRIENLRDVSPSMNSENQRKARKDSRSGVLGVGCAKGTWQATITVKQKVLHLGTFETIDAASDAYLKAKRRFHLGCTL